MYIRYCDSCRKELKDSDHFWECKDWSRPPFIAKLHIALKETAETEYWLRLLYKSDNLDVKMFESLLNDCLELKKILISSIKTAKRK